MWKGFRLVNIIRFWMKYSYNDNVCTECSCDMSSDHHYSCHNNSSIYGHNEQKKSAELHVLL